MIKSKLDLAYYLNRDAIRNDILSYRQYLIRLFFGAENACVVRYLRALRHQEYYLNNKDKSVIHKIGYFWYKFRTTRLSKKYRIGIMVNVVGPGLRIPHILGGVIINCNQMGENCEVNSGVIIGNKDNNQSLISTIGNGVVISIGSKIIGKVSIGNNAIIAPNAVVIKDVPENTVVGGVPAKIIKVL